MQAWGENADSALKAPSPLASSNPEPKANVQYIKHTGSQRSKRLEMDHFVITVHPEVFNLFYITANCPRLKNGIHFRYLFCTFNVVEHAQNKLVSVITYITLAVHLSF